MKRNRDQPPPVQIGDELELEIEALADGPDGLGWVEGYVLFVPGALPGELVRVRVVSASRKFGRTMLLDTLRRAKERVTPPCEHFGECGGCQLQHLAYPAQLAHKTERLRKTLAYALGQEELPIAPMRGPDNPLGQRTKIALHLQELRGRLEAGLYKTRTREIVPIRECPVSDPKGLSIALGAVDAAQRAGITSWFAPTDRGQLRSIVVRAASGGAQLTFVARRALDEAKLLGELASVPAASVALNEHDGPQTLLLGRTTRLLRGEPRVSEQIGGVKFLSSPGTFFQTSRFGATFLVDAVRRLVDPPKDALVLDLYCGGGLLGLALASRAREVIGFEENPRAVRDAEASAKANGFTNARFLAGPVEERLGAIANGARPFAILLDPPREGCDPRVVQEVLRLAPDKLLYVSCAPEALARDLVELRAGGYSAVVIEPFDMFPHTHHIEAVVMLERTELAARRRLLRKATTS